MNSSSLSSLILVAALAPCPDPVIKGGDATWQEIENWHKGCASNYGNEYCAIEVRLKKEIQHTAVICGKRRDK